jgi:hypothetical protein
MAALILVKMTLIVAVIALHVRRSTASVQATLIRAHMVLQSF